MKVLLISLRYLLFMSLFLGIIYPLSSLVIGKVVFPKQTDGSLVKINGEVRGSELIAQKFTEPKYFWPRPSAVDYQAQAGAATNRSGTHEKLSEEVTQRRNQLGLNAPADLLYTSGSGLDPHISLEAAFFQRERVASSRGLSIQQIGEFISQATEQRLLGFMGQVRVNVLELNRILDKFQK